MSEAGRAGKGGAERVSRVCSEGCFCRLAAKQGASKVVGYDTRFKALLAARLQTASEGLRVSYRMGVFDPSGFRGNYDYVLCLSVLHHCVSTKDIWKVISNPAFEEDRRILRAHLRALAAQTNMGGRCIIELPFEYDDPDERAEVDFEKFVTELVSAGFKKAECIGTWDHSDRNKEKKDRMIYVAHA